jgi:hypothetical protein
MTVRWPKQLTRSKLERRYRHIGVILIDVGPGRLIPRWTVFFPDGVELPANNLSQAETIIRRHIATTERP